jgi:hypothetical protein
VRLFGVIILAGFLSAAAALAATIVGLQVFICRSDPAGCGMAMAYQVLLVPVYAIAAVIAFGIAMAFANRLRAITVTAFILVGLTVLLFVFGIASDASSGRQTNLSDVVELLQVLIPFWVTVAVQWFAIRFFLQRRVAGAVA